MSSDNPDNKPVQIPDTRDPQLDLIADAGLSFLQSKVKFGFPVIGIGASAGGLESLEQLFDEIPPDSNAAFVIVQHLSPDFKSMMDEILARRTKMTVRRIEDGMSVKPSTVYLIPPKVDLEIQGEILVLKDREVRQGLNQPIDRFFTSMAISRGPACAAVVCSGSGSDGSRGIRDVCEAGGMVLVEDPETARFDGMPRSAMESGVADFAGNMDQIATWLGRFITSFSDRIDTGNYADTGDLIARVPAVGLGRVIELLRDEYQINFSQYKPNMIVRRIERRWRLLHFASIEEYIELLETDANELNQLYRDLLIGVTRFFRDTEAFDVLANKVLPRLIEESRGQTMRVWTPGCATGEEAYSLAMTIAETMEAKGQVVDVKIFATDAHRLSLDKAASGTYTIKEVDGISPELLEKHFQKVGSSYRVNQSLRKMIVFAPQNLLNDASFTNIDLAICRNTLIYFGDEGQRRALSLMHFGLRIGGVLFLGPSETPGEIEGDYETINRRWRMYKKVSASKLGTASLRAPARLSVPRSEPVGRSGSATVYTDRMILSAIEGLADDYLPPTFVTNSDFTLLYSTPGSAKFLRRQEGRFGATLPELLLPKLKTSVLVGLQRCERQKEVSKPVVVGKIAVPLSELEGNAPGDAGGSDDPQASGDAKQDFRLVGVVIRRVDLAGKQEHGFSVSVIEESEKPIRGVLDSGEAVDLSAQATLEEELRHTKESLQSTIQELETSNEELQATNEEMVASNEELQSTNEELHSVNEELYTVNAEHQSKIEELTEVTEDMENLFRSANVATLFLDDESRIRRMTPQAAEIFDLTHDDIGRRLDNFRNPLNDDELYDLIATTFANQKPLEREVMGKSGERFLLRLMPYDSTRDLSGTVLTLVSLRRLEQARTELETREARFRGTFENAAVGIAHVDFDGTWLRVNQRLCDLVGYSREELLAINFQSITHPADLDSDLEQFEQLKAGELSSYTLRKRYVDKFGRDVPIDLTVSIQQEPGDDKPYCIAVIQDAREQVRAQKLLEEAISQRDQFLAVLSHELRNPLGAVKNAVSLLRRTNDAEIKRDELTDLLDRQTDHMSRLVEDLLDTSRIAQNKIVLQRELMDLKEVAEESIRSLQGSFDQKQQHVRLELDADRFPVVGDRVRLLQVVENLLANARRYTQVGGQIEVRLSVDAGRVALQVKDNGQGISEDNLETIFNMFTRGRETEETQGGLGVGLALVKMLVDKHDGTLKASSDGVGKGSTFTLTFPMVAVPAGVKLAHAPEEAPSTEAIKPFKIVLVEDDKDARSTMEQLLELDGHDVTVAVDGNDGLEKIRDVHPDFALIDISMPGMSGLEVANLLKKESPGILKDTKLIALTGHGQPQDIRRTQEAGFSGHLVKPVDVAVLGQLMNELSSN
ncbi:two-component system CheB/CheR fusion protein [Rhodopirellula rubra]|uniref:Two-component system CheB/CheR fusion protein n=1 Tax=Aporhodopirellula rubra TaxID=980271 RepID=A0A7W5E5C0_9BACT|nr:chemotaxis protein CheB [Aporhodopirellula rubra]MBB3210479.1 two-component system CheB/CheR fusion protein [Aporhodopirellula rubra]